MDKNKEVNGTIGGKLVHFDCIEDGFEALVKLCQLQEAELDKHRSVPEGVDKLKQIYEKCKCSITIAVNHHRDYYMTVEQRLDELRALDCPPDIPEEICEEMIRRDTVIDIQVYPDTPNGSYSVFHYDLDKALDLMLEAIE